MTTKQMTDRIDALLAKYDGRLDEALWQERQPARATPSPEYLRGQREMLSLICLDLETLLMEVGRP